MPGMGALGGVSGFFQFCKGVLKDLVVLPGNIRMGFLDGSGKSRGGDQQAENLKKV